MKNHKLVFDEVFEKKEEYEKSKRIRTKKYISAACSFVLVAAFAVGGYALFKKNGNIIESPSGIAESGVSASSVEESKGETGEEGDKKAPVIISGGESGNADDEPSAKEEMLFLPGAMILTHKLSTAIEQNRDETYPPFYAVTLEIWTEGEGAANVSERKAEFYAEYQHFSVTVRTVDSTYRFRQNRGGNWDGSSERVWDVAYLTEEDIRSVTVPDDCMFFLSLVPEYAAYDCGSVQHDVIDDCITDEEGRYLVRVDCDAAKADIDAEFEARYGVPYRKDGERVEDAIMRLMGREGEKFYLMSEEMKEEYQEKFFEYGAAYYDIELEFLSKVRDEVIYDYGYTSRLAGGEERKTYHGFWIYLSWGEINEIFADSRVKEIGFAEKDPVIYK